MNRRSLRSHERVLIDTSVWIYHFEQHPQFGAAAGQVLEDLEAGRFQGIASELTLLELTVRPLQLGRQDVADEYELLLSYFPHLTLEPISREILLDAASLRPLSLTHTRRHLDCDRPQGRRDHGGNERCSMAQGRWNQSTAAVGSRGEKMTSSPRADARSDAWVKASTSPPRTPRDPLRGG